MSDVLRQHITDMLAEHDHWDYAGDLQCQCGESFHSGPAAENREPGGKVHRWAEHVADLLIERLGLQQEWATIMDGSTLSPTRDKSMAEWELANAEHNNASHLKRHGRIPDFAHNPRIETRYVTPWTGEKP